MASLSVTGLTVTYGNLVAVHELDLEVEAGEVVVVLGPNGAGKSSMLNAISGSIKAASGEIVFNGTRTTGWPAHRVARAGLVLLPEGRRVFGPLSVEENLIVGGAIRKRARRAELLDDVYGMFPILHDRRKSPAGVLSGGEQQMLAFGRALMSEPQMLMLDEPSMGLAPVVVETIMDAISRIAARDMSILMVEQNAAVGLDMASRAYVVEQGRMVLSGAADDIARDPLVLRAFLGLEEEREESSKTGPSTG